MNILLSFIGKLPDYTIECIYQIRLYYNGDIYLIYDDYNCIFIDKLLKYNIKLINYEDVNKHELDNYINKFTYVNGLFGRELLFYRSYERMFLANNLIEKLSLKDTIFMEIDNLLYDNPENWIEEFSVKGIAYMPHSNESCSSGIMYIKDNNSINELTNYLLKFLINNSSEFISEMLVLKKYYDDNNEKIYMMPILYNDIKNNINIDTYKNYKHHLYDPAIYGIYLLGFDTFHTNGKIIKGISIEDNNYLVSNQHIVYNKYKIEFKTINGYKKPYILDENINEWVLIRNLHVHSKDLISGLSKDINDTDYDIITGEKMQMLADIYICLNKEEINNPKIINSNKNLLIKDIPEKYNNPKIIYMYNDSIINLSNIIDRFENNFILISGNSDEDIIEEKYKNLADNPKIIKWYTQNLCFKHNKIEPFTIGLANERWLHGYSQDFINIYKQNNKKINEVYFNFNINTHYSRIECYNKLINIYNFLEFTNPIENFKRLSSYKFCICPRGNGIDTHRLAECWYLKVVPIILENDYVNIIKNNISLPIIILKDWNELKNMKLNYNDYNFNYDKYIDFNYYKNIINDS